MPSMNELPANYKVYKNGAVFDTDKGRIVAMRPELATKNTIITRENTAEYLSKRLDKKRARIEAGAMAAVQDKMPDSWTGEDGDWIEAVAQQVAYKALDKLDPKQVDAARFLLQEAGLADKQAVASPVEQMSDLLTALASFAASIAPSVQPLDAFDNSSYRNHDIVDGTVTAAQDSGGEEEAEKDDGG